MKKFKIITDSGCDLSYKIIKYLDICYLGLECDLDGIKIIEDGGEILNYSEFYNKLINGVMPKTSQINPKRFFEEFKKTINDGSDILYIAFSSELSGTYNSALIAREELLDKYPDAHIIVLDSKSASSGQGLLVYLAAKLKDKGWELDQIALYIEESKKRLYHFFTVKDLKHLERGGRISSTSAIFGSALKINPILTITEEGGLQAIGKVRGEKKVLKELVKNIENNVDDKNIDMVFISHADNYGAAEYLSALIFEKFNVKEIIINYMGLAIGSHTGQGAIGLYFMGKLKN